MADIVEFIFFNCNTPLLYWAKIDSEQDRKIAIEIYKNKKLLEQSLEKKSQNLIYYKNLMKLFLGNR